ncbi:mucin-2 isoform X2 [Lutzomyia longipalpis]|uniref:mucin-2 isoform X2 n=1 Tax=Lutzomyia longipalpis TaxID=7200 RepID=UPI00248471D2|nr:mucin-2 isoform X2 [Lutzomyia longipalpis]XP_055690073.1 mucin-2 isoform X2 [Lutzomyia longipalpis]
MVTDASRMLRRGVTVPLCVVLFLLQISTVATDTLPIGSQTLGGLSAREKPELSEHLSAVIGEDVAKSIEYKRQVEEAELGSTARPPPLTTPSSDSTPKSRIQIKTAPNGVDYEYEYVYYYYDEDEDANKTTTANNQERGRSKYQTIERTSKAPPQADEEKPVAEVEEQQEDEEEERLPQNTRFPPRSRNTPEQASTEAPPAAKVSVKHPSLELVDSDTFNTADNRNLYSTPQQNDGAMEKAAFDLYVILQNEKMAVDATAETTTKDATTVEATTEIETTTQEVTTTTRRTTTTTTTTTTEAPAVETRRIAQNNVAAGTRNRFKLRPGTTTTTTEAPAAEKTGFVSKSRYGGKPSGSRVNTFGRNLSTTSVPSTTSQTETESKPSFGTRGTRTRNRFNIRSTTEGTSQVQAEETSTTSRPARPRATFSARSRSRLTTVAPSEEVANRTETTTARPRIALPSRPGANRLLAPRKNPLIRGSTPAPSTEAPAAAAAGEDLEESDTSPETPPIRPEPEKTSNYLFGQIESTTTSQSGLNRLKNRPRIQIQPAERPKTTQNVFANRKVNPLIARRQFGVTSSTSESPPEVEETEPQSEEDSEDADTAEDNHPEQTEPPSSEAPRGLGLLGARRRLPLRRPGTLYSGAN